MSPCSCDASQNTHKCDMCGPCLSGSHLTQDRPVICPNFLRFARASGGLARWLVCVTVEVPIRYQEAMSGGAADGMIPSADLNIQIPKAGLGIFSTGQSSRGPAPDPKIRTGFALYDFISCRRMRWSAFCSIAKLLDEFCVGLRAFLVAHREDSFVVGQVTLALQSVFRCPPSFASSVGLHRWLCVGQI